MTPQDVLDILSGAGVLGFSVLAIYALLTERVVPRSRLDEQRADKREAVELAKAAVAGLEKLSEAIEVRNRLEETRLRNGRENRR